MFAFELLAAFIEEPKRAAALAAAKRPWALGLAALAVSGASLFLSQAAGRHFLPVGSGPASCAIVCLCFALGGFLLAAALHLLADAAGCVGSGAGLFVLLGLSSLAWALVLPCALILRACHADSALALLPLLTLGGALSLRLKARSIRHIYGLSAARAWWLLGLPYIGAFVLFAAAIFAALFGAALSLVRAFT